MNSSAFSVARSLRRKLLLPLLLIGAALAMGAVWSIYATFQNQIVNRVRQRAELVANAVNYAAESVSRPGELQRIVTAIGAEEEVSLIVVAGGRPARVLATTRNAWLGLALTELPLQEVAEDLEKAVLTRQSHNHLHQKTSQFDFTSPLLLSRPELADRALTDGAVMVHLDMRSTQAAIRQLTIEFSIAFLAALVILSALGYGVIHHFVLRPISRIGKLVEQRREGGGESWAEAATDDELGALARALHDSLTRADAALHELRRSETQFRSVWERSGDGMRLTDGQGVVLLVNQAYCDMAGKIRGEIEGQSLTEIYAADLRQYMQQKYLERYTRRAFEPRMERKVRLWNGKEIWLAVSTTMINADEPAPKVLDLFRDITERKQAEEDLRESRQLLRQILDAIPVRVFWKDMNLTYLGCNQPFALDSGLRSSEEMIGKSDLDMYWKAQAELYRADDRRVIESGQPKLGYEEPQTKPDGGGLIWLRTSKVPLRDAGGQIKGVLGVFWDITERKRAEEDLRESRQLLRQILDAIPVRVFWKDMNLTYLGCNQPFALDSGLRSSEEMVGKNDLEMPWKEQAELYRADDRRVIESGQPKLGYEEPQTKPDGGGLIWLRTSKVPLRDAGGQIKGVLGTYEDITERKRAEQEREKLIGQLQAALADVKTLAGLIPICSGCMKIRDDKNYWHRVDSYITKQTGAKFTHGLCPDCAKKYFPDYEKENDAKHR